MLVPRSISTDFVPTPGVAPMTRAPIIFEGVLRLKTGQRFGALGGSEFILQELVFQPEPVDFRPQLAALFARVSQFEIVAEETGRPVAHGSRSRWRPA